MAACYHTDVEFSDPVFPALRGRAAGDMWRMLCERGADLRVVATGIEADDAGGRADWEAWYTFSATGRPVHNRVHATFDFRDGLIVRHRDAFSFRAWAAQALGTVGRLLGWTGLLRRRVQRTAAASLAAWVRRRGAG
jgi:ketosteroid isomerase-like protein